MVAVISFVGGYLDVSNIILFPVLGILTFSIAFISIYGFRASLISFSGLLALVLSFAYDSKTLEIYEYALLVGLGGIWYLLLSTILHYINPKAHTEETFIETFTLTADFLDTRRQLIGEQPDREALQTKLMTIQSDLMERHDTLREILLTSRRSSGKSNYQGKRLLVFIQLIEFLETAVANPVNYKKMDALFEKHPKFKTDFQDILLELSTHLRWIAEQIGKSKTITVNKKFSEAFKTLEQDILELKERDNPEDYEHYLMLQNYFEYQKKQYNKLNKIKWLLGNPNLSSEDYIKKDILKNFINSPDYNPKLLLRSLSFRSTIFKHSLRLSVTMMLGYGIGVFFHLQNPYWIMLTIIIIMRPSYGLTKTRSKDRIIGTLIGAVLASGLVFLIQNPYVYGALGVITLVVAFSMVQKNFKASAVFITLSVIFIYAILQPNIIEVIGFRVLDTVIGSVLSFIAMLWLWPAWSFMEIGSNLKDSLKANAEFFNAISNYYQIKGKVPTSLKVKRKEAFLQTSNLSSAFQRMAQEPESKQNHIEDIYELVVLNHSFLSSLSSLNTYIQNHQTTEASEDFKVISNKISDNLDIVCENLKSVDFELPKAHVKDVTLKTEKFEFPASRITYEAILQSNDERNHKEAHLVWEQLYWLFSISEKMIKITAKF